jgi:hypothetical protein
MSDHDSCISTEPESETEDQSGSESADEFETDYLVPCACCLSDTTMCYMDNLDNVIFRLNSEFLVRCGNGSQFDMDTYYFREKESWAAAVLATPGMQPFMCDRCIARYILDGKLLPHRYEIMKQLAETPVDVDLGLR